MKRFLALLCLLFALLLLASCAGEPRPERVSAEELARLREEYPISDKLSGSGNYNFDPMQTWEGMAESSNLPYALVVLEITGPRFINTIYLNPFSSSQANQAVGGAQRLDGQFIPAKVLRCLGGEFELEKGEEISVGFGTYVAILPEDLDAAYQVGNRYVCVLKDTSSLNVPYTAENMYGTTKYQTFYLTDDDVLLTMTSHLACLNECSGMYLDAFEDMLQEVLPPDAEITDPTPGVEKQ